MSKNPIKYTSGGRLGDFINQLSVINEKYLKTGRKGILYIGFTGDKFSNKIQGTYTDTYEIIKSQPYIEDYKIHKGEKYDIDLSRWRNDMTSGNLYNIFSRTYNIEWGKTKWLFLDEDKYYDEKWKDIVLINTTKRRFKNLDYDSLYEKYNDNLIFISYIENDYSYFLNKTNLKIQNYIPISFEDLCIAINSCKLFVGGLSMPLTIAYALKKELVIASPKNPSSLEETHNSGYDSLWKNATYLKIKK